MKRLIITLALVSISVIISACTKRQPYTQEAEEGQCELKFKAAKNPESVLTLAYQYVPPVSEKPSHLKDLPEGLSEDCKYFVAKLADRDIPIVLDSPENRQDSVLYVDTDGDGRLSNEKGYTATPTEERGLAYRFGPVPLKFDKADGQVKTEFYVMTRRGEYLTLYPTGYRVGKIRLGNKNYRVAVIDGNFDGWYDKIFSPPVEDFYRPACDLFAIDRNGDDRLSWDYLEVMPLSTMVRIPDYPRDAYYNIEVATDGNCLELKKTEPKFGTLDLGGAQVQCRLWSDASEQVLSGSGKEGWLLPAGRYSASPIELRQVDASGNRWIFRSSRETGKLKDFEIRPGEKTSFQLGPPFSIRTTAEQNGEIVSIGFWLEAQAGVWYSAGAQRDRSRVPEPRFRVIGESGEVVNSGQFKYG
jgi:hypothetical protein